MPPLSPKQQQAELAERIATNRADLIKVLAKSRERIENLVLRSARDPKLASQIARRERLYASIRDEYISLNGNLSTMTDNHVQAGMRSAFDSAKDDLKASGASLEGLGWTKFSSKHLQDTIARVNPYSVKNLVAVNTTVAQMAYKDIKQLRDAVVDVFRESAASGWTARERQMEMMRRVTQVGEELTSWQFIDKSGRKWSKGNYFNMVNRTVAAEVHRSSYADTAIDAGHDLVQVIGGSSTHDKVCQNKPVGYVGRILSITGATEGYPTVDEAKADGLFHPNCVHSYIVVIEDMPDNEELIASEQGQPKPDINKPKKREKSSVKAGA